MKSNLGVLVFALAVAIVASEQCKVKWDMARHTFTIGRAIEALTQSSNMSGQVPRKITVGEGAQCGGSLDDGATYHGIDGHVVDGSNGNKLHILYDKNGIIAGMQIRMPKQQMDTTGFDYSSQPAYMMWTKDGIQHLVLTVYFVSNPSKICTEGRTEQDLESQGTGNAVMLQVGPNPNSDVHEGPLCRSVAMDKQPNHKYSNNNCFPGMGTHSFYDMESWESKSCHSIHPLYLLYNGQGHLTGFGFIMPGHANTNEHLFEHPSRAVMKAIAGDLAPNCLLDLAEQNKLTTMHFFFTKDIYNCEITDVLQKFRSAWANVVEKTTESLHAAYCRLPWVHCQEQGETTTTTASSSE